MIQNQSKIMKSLLVIPTLNEIDGMKQVISKINHDWVDEILIVDGGSIDGTIEEAKKQNINVLMQTTKGSHGAAILDAFNSSDADYLLMFGADGNNEPEEIPKMLSKIKEGYDQVINSRFSKTSKNDDAGLIDGFGNRMFTIFANLVFGGNLPDTLSSSRAITRKAWDEIEMDELGLSNVYQISIRGMIKKQKIFSLAANEPARVGGERKMHRIPTGIQLSLRLLKELSWKGKT
jgi:glycosyltransferase involved in cell wall biosynthesis